MKFLDFILLAALILIVWEVLSPGEMTGWVRYWLMILSHTY